MPSRIGGDDLHVTGRLTCGSFVPPPLSIDDDAIDGPLAPDNLTCFTNAGVQLFSETAVVDNLNRLLCITNGTSGQLIDFKAMMFTAGTSGSFTVDLQKSTPSTTWASVLAGPITFTTTDAVRTAKAGTISSAGMAAGNSWRLAVLTTGSTATQALGLLASVRYSETYL